MKTTIKVLSVLASAVLLCGFASCSDDDEPSSGIQTPITDERPDNYGDDSKITDEKAYFEETAKLFLNKFKASDQEAIIRMANDFVNDYEELDMPDEFGKAPAAAMMKSISRSLASADIYGLSRSYESYYYAISKYSGIYEPGKYSWVRVGDSDDLVFQYNDHSGRKCSATAKASKESWSGNITVDGDTYSAEVPRQIDITVMQGSTEMLTATVKTNYVKNSSLEVTVNTKAANLEVNTTLNADNSSVNTATSFAVNGSVIVAAVGKVSGSNLCKQDYIQDLIENEDSDGLYKLFSNAIATADVLGRIQVKGELSNLKDIVEAMDFDDWSKEEADNGAKALNKYLKGTFYLNGASKERGTIEWQSYLDYYDDWSWNGESYHYEEWDVEPLLKFKDGTTYSIDSYFGNGKFASVESIFENLVDSYEALWK